MSNKTAQSQPQNSQKNQSKTGWAIATLFQYISSVIIFLPSLFAGYLLARMFIESQNPNGWGGLALIPPILFIMVVGTFLAFAILRFGVGRYLLRESLSTSVGKIVLEFVLWSIFLAVSVYVVSDLWFWQLFEDICHPICLYWLP